MKTINTTCFIAIALAATLFSAAIVSCSEERNETVRERNPNIEELGKSLNMLQTERNQARYGTVKGNYPEESKAILDEVILAVARLIVKTDKGETVSSAQIEQARTSALAAIEAFRATVRTETLLFPAELYVNGNEDGYIDFGYSPEYSRFGENGRQAFTVELWVKYKTMPGGIGSIVSTFLENGGTRCGWMMNMINSDYLRMTCTSNLEHQMWEPGDEFRDTETWVHIAAVYDDKGVDGASRDGKPIILKFYRNGEWKNSADNDNPGRYYNPADDEKFDRLSMIAFAQHNTDGTRTRKTQGYIKHFRIWKSAKTEEQIRGLMNGTTAVNGTEPDLSCAWTFDKQVEDENDIKDLTGRHSASLHGNCQWEILD